jgi:probable HAF family extracellular repeat protein
MELLTRALILLPFLALSHRANADPVRYQVDVIGNYYNFIEGWNYRPTAINNLGQVVGASAYEYTNGESTHRNDRAFMWDAGKFTYVQDNNTDRMVASAINDSGAIVGAFYTYDAHYAAVMGAGGTALIDSSLGRSQGTPAINNSGQIAVTADVCAKTYPYKCSAHLYLYSTDGARTDFNLGASGSVSSLNNSGSVAGQYWSTTGSHAFRYSDGSLHDLGTLGGNDSGALAMNDNGVVVGYSRLVPNQNEFHAVIFGDSGPVDLGTIAGGQYSEAMAINNLGQIVGDAWFPSKGGFLYENGVMMDLTTFLDPGLGMVVTGAIDINDRGQILATVYVPGSPDNLNWAVVLSPVPEPSDYATMLAGLGVLATLSARRRRLKR